MIEVVHESSNQDKRVMIRMLEMRIELLNTWRSQSSDTYGKKYLMEMKALEETKNKLLAHLG